MASISICCKIHRFETAKYQNCTRKLSHSSQQPVIRSSEVIVLTKQTNKQRDSVENIHLASLRYAGGKLLLDRIAGTHC